MLLKFRLQRLLKTDRFCCNYMHQGSTLHAREDQTIDRFSVFRLAHHDTTSWSTQTLVGGRGDKIGDSDRSGMDASRHETSDMRNVDEKIGTHQIRNFPHLVEINHPRIRGGSSGDHLGTMLLGDRREKIIIDPLSLPIYAIMHDPRKP